MLGLPHYEAFMHLSMLSAIPPVWGGWGFDLVGNQVPLPGDDLQNQKPT